MSSSLPDTDATSRGIDGRLSRKGPHARFTGPDASEDEMIKMTPLVCPTDHSGTKLSPIVHDCGLKTSYSAANFT
jgi:hypothetical protein